MPPEVSDSLVLRQDVEDKVLEFLEESGLQITQTLCRSFLALANELYNYHEEGRRLAPSILFGVNIGKRLGEVPNRQYVVLRKGGLVGFDFKGALKPIIPLSETGWIPFVDLSLSRRTYSAGVLNAFNGIHGHSVSDILWELGPPRGLVQIDVLSQHRVRIRGRGNVILDNSVISQETALECFPPQFVIDATKDIPKSDNSRFKQVLNRLFQLIQRRVGGCILALYRSSIVKSPVKDSIWLENPISLRELSESLVHTDSRFSEQQLHANVALFLNMLNTDGATALDSSGVIRGYHLFVPVQDRTNRAKKPTGGARMRAALDLVHSKQRSLVGVFFKSHDGRMFYSRKRR